MVGFEVPEEVQGFEGIEAFGGFESWGLLKFRRALKLIFWWDSRSLGGIQSLGGRVKVLEGLKLILGLFKVLEGSRFLGVLGFGGC